MSNATKVAWIRLWQAVLVAAIGALPGFLGGAYWQRLENNVSSARLLASGVLPDEFEWQWAGENWYGRVGLSSEGEPRAVTMARVFKLNKEYQDARHARFVFGEDPVIDLVRGTVALSETGSLKVSLLVNKLSSDETAYVPHEIKGELKPIVCFAGEVEYINTTTREHPRGDMILVNCESSPARVTSEIFDPHRVYEGRPTARSEQRGRPVPSAAPELP